MSILYGLFGCYFLLPVHSVTSSLRSRTSPLRMNLALDAASTSPSEFRRTLRVNSSVSGDEVRKIGPKSNFVAAEGLWAELSLSGHFMCRGRKNGLIFLLWWTWVSKLCNFVAAEGLWAEFSTSGNFMCRGRKNGLIFLLWWKWGV